MCEIILYDYWRSSACYRVRIALNHLGVNYSTVRVNLLKREHKSATHLERQPQGLVPAIDIDGQTLRQSLAIIEYLNDTRTHSELLPPSGAAKARVRSLSYAIAMEIHPLCNASVVTRIADLAGGGENLKIEWMQEFIFKGLANFETLLQDGKSGKYSHGNEITMADCCLIPQLYNARRWGVDYAQLKTICAIEEVCKTLPAFQKAYPDNCQP